MNNSKNVDLEYVENKVMNMTGYELAQLIFEALDFKCCFETLGDRVLEIIDD